MSRAQFAALRHKHNPSHRRDADGSDCDGHALHFQLIRNAWILKLGRLKTDS